VAEWALSMLKALGFNEQHQDNSNILLSVKDRNMPLVGIDVTYSMHNYTELHSIS
jgi:hypothetical protein